MQVTENGAARVEHDHDALATFPWRYDHRRAPQYAEGPVAERHEERARRHSVDLESALLVRGDRLASHGESCAWNR